MSKEHSEKLLLELLEKMYLGRKFEERVQWLFSQGLVHGTTHLGIGEEATAAGSVSALKPRDYVFGTHRGHSQALAKGIDLNAMMAEILAKKTGVCHGMGGSMHIADPDIFYFGADGVLGASAVMANGVGLTIKKHGEKDRIVAIFFGDGTANEGAVFEAFNLAALWELPVLFICINNEYGMSTHISKVMKDTDIAKRALPFGMPAKTIDGNDVLKVYDTIAEAREYVLNNGPMLIVENTYRISGHSKSDGNLYRTKEEIETWKQKCPIKAFRAYLEKEAGIGVEKMDAIEKRVQEQIEASVEFAKKSGDPTMDELMNNVWA